MRHHFPQPLAAFCLLSGLLLTLAAGKAQAQSTACRVTVNPERVVREIDPRFFGANTLFMVDDDRALADGKIAQHLRALPCRLLRFPGGDVADNYHWRTHTLDDPKWWPKKAGPTTTDTDEFMAFCRQVGAEPIFVVNLESCLLRGDVEAGAREAAEWVRYCNVEKGYAVRLWEIGNETHLYTPGKHKRLPVTARQYGEAFRRFATAMKAVDPTIQVGAVGQLNLERLAGLGGRRDEGPWWSVLVKVIGDQLDFVVVHEYWSASFGERTDRAGTVRGFRAFLQEQYPKRHIPIALTEWNLSAKTRGSEAERALLLAERIGDYLQGGIDWANFWPLRISGKEWAGRGLLSPTTREPEVAYQVLHLFASRLGTRLLDVECSHRRVYPLASADATGRVSLFLAHLDGKREAIPVTLTVPGSQEASATAWVAKDAGGALVQAPCPVTRQGEAWQLQLPPGALAVVTLRPSQP